MVQADRQSIAGKKPLDKFVGFFELKLESKPKTKKEKLDSKEALKRFVDGMSGQERTIVVYKGKNRTKTSTTRSEKIPSIASKSSGLKKRIELKFYKIVAHKTPSKAERIAKGIARGVRKGVKGAKAHIQGPKVKQEPTEADVNTRIEAFTKGNHLERLVCIAEDVKAREERPMSDDPLTDATKSIKKKAHKFVINNILGKLPEAVKGKLIKKLSKDSRALVKYSPKKIYKKELKIADRLINAEFSRIRNDDQADQMIVRLEREIGILRKRQNREIRAEFEDVVRGKAKQLVVEKRKKLLEAKRDRLLKKQAKVENGSEKKNKYKSDIKNLSELISEETLRIGVFENISDEIRQRELAIMELKGEPAALLEQLDKAINKKDKIEDSILSLQGRLEGVRDGVEGARVEELIQMRKKQLDQCFKNISELNEKIKDRGRKDDPNAVEKRNLQEASKKFKAQELFIQRVKDKADDRHEKSLGQLKDTSSKVKKLKRFQKIWVKLQGINRAGGGMHVLMHGLGAFTGAVDALFNINEARRHFQKARENQEARQGANLFLQAFRNEPNKNPKKIEKAGLALRSYIEESYPSLWARIENTEDIGVVRLGEKFADFIIEHRDDRGVEAIPEDVKSQFFKLFSPHLDRELLKEFAYGPTLDKNSTSEKAKVVKQKALGLTDPDLEVTAMRFRAEHTVKRNILKGVLDLLKTGRAGGKIAYSILFFLGSGATAVFPPILLATRGAIVGVTLGFAAYKYYKKVGYSDKLKAAEKDLMKMQEEKANLNESDPQFKQKMENLSYRAMECHETMMKYDKDYRVNVLYSKLLADLKSGKDIDVSSENVSGTSVMLQYLGVPEESVQAIADAANPQAALDLLKLELGLKVEKKRTLDFDPSEFKVKPDEPGLLDRLGNYVPL